MSIFRRLQTAALVSFAFVLAPAAVGADLRPVTLADLPPPPHPPLLAAIAPLPTTVAQGGQLIFLDPVTGTVSRNRPDAAALNAATAGMPRVVIDLSLKTTPEGYVYIDTSELHETATAVIAADGTVHIDCGHPADHPSHAAPERKR